jgi:flagellar protein FlaF
MMNAWAAYDRNAAADPREIEAAAFAFVNRSLTSATEGADRVRALGRNHKLWSMLLADIGLTGNALPSILKKDLVSLGAWSMSYSINAMTRDCPLQPLIDINNDMIDALRPAGQTSKAPARRSENERVVVAV